MDNSMKRLECPYTWQIPEKLAFDYNEEENPVVEVDEQPVLALINSVMITFIQMIRNKRGNSIENLRATKEIWKKMDKSRLKSEGISQKVLEHIINATKYYSYKIINNSPDIENLRNEEIFHEDIEKGTIDGCKAIAWSMFDKHGHKRALVFANQAVSLSPNCPMWHLILGKSLRHARRENNVLVASDREKNAFLKCYHLSEPFYRIFVAQIYLEDRNTECAKRIYEEVFQANPKSYGILLKLARAFTIFKNFDKAKFCFEKAEFIRKDSMFYYYKGLFYEKQNKLKLASENYKNAAKIKNYRADVQYACTMTKLNRNYNIINYLKIMTNKYEKNLLVTQQIFLHIALQYEKKDIKNSLKYFLKAIEMKPDSSQLREFYNVTMKKDWKPYDIFNFVENKLCTYGALPIPADMKSTVKKLKYFCEQQKVLYS